MQLIAFVLMSTVVSGPPAAPLGDRMHAASSARDDASPSDDDALPEDEEQASEMEELRALEEVSLDPQAKPSADVLQTIGRLGVGNPLRERIDDALSVFELGGEPALIELPRITNLASLDVSKIRDQFDIPVEMQPLVAQYIQFFQGPGRKWFRNWMSRSTRYIPLMHPVLEAAGVPKDTVYLAMIESGFSPRAFSWARAAGPWQFISSTARLFGLKQDFWVDERRDPFKATEAAARLLDRLHSELGDWYLAWAAYNAGRMKVLRLMDRKGTSNFWELSEGRGFAKETKHYVPKLIACALVAKNPKAFGFDNDEFDFLSPLDTVQVKLTEPADLEALARAAEMPVDELKELNPELRRWCTPPASEKKPYWLRLPKSAEQKFGQNFSRLSGRERLAFQVHRVRKGETLSGIASAHHSAAEAILRLNGLRSARMLRVNAELVVPVPSSQAMKAGKADPLFERQVARARRGGFVAPSPDQEIPAGTPRKVAAVQTGTIKTEVIQGRTKVTYGVQDGDTLWGISQHFACSVDEIRKWNRLPKRSRGLRIGTVLVLWPEIKTASAAEPRTASAN